MPILPAGEIGRWSETRLTRFVEDWFRNHQLPATKAIQVDALMIGTQQVVAVADPADLSATGLQGFSGPVDVPELTVGGNVLPGSEIGYDQITSGVSVGLTNTSVIAGSAHIFDGSPVLAEFFTPDLLLPSVAGATVNIFLFDGVTQVVILTVATSQTATSSRNPVTATFRFSPSAGSHTYNIKAAASSTTGVPVVQAGTGTVPSNIPPAYLRFTKV